MLLNLSTPFLSKALTAVAALSYCKPHLVTSRQKSNFPLTDWAAYNRYYTCTTNTVRNPFVTMNRTFEDGCGGPGITYTPAEYNHVVICLHGLGDSAAGWDGFMVQLQRRQGLFLKTKYIVPTAKTRPISLNGGLPQTAWANIIDLDPKGQQDAEGYYESNRRIHQIIDMEINDNKIQPQNIIVGGFSQGGALAYLSGLSYKEALGGIVVMSGWLPFKGDEINSVNITDNSKKTEILHCHGTADPLVRMEWGIESAKHLRDDFKLNVTIKTYPVVHSVTDEELDDVGDFIQKIFEKPQNEV